MFPIAAKNWLAKKTNPTATASRYYRQYVGKLIGYFGNRLISDITAEDVAGLQKLRNSKGLSGRHVNAEVGTLRAILRYYGAGHGFRVGLTMLPQRSDVRRALSREDEQRLTSAISESPSPSLYPFFILSLDAGLRPSETRSLRLSNLKVTWKNGVISEGEIVVGRSKTDAGTGRAVPLTHRACGALSQWLIRFPRSSADKFVFRFHRVALAGNQRLPHIYDVQLDRAMGESSYRTAFETACRKSGIALRFYDARHTFLIRLAENPAVSEETIRQLAGHVSPRMLSRYAHIRVQARRDAIAGSKSATKGRFQSIATKMGHINRTQSRNAPKGT